MLLKNFNNNREYDVTGPVYENIETKIWCGTCNYRDKKYFVKILNYGAHEDEKTRRELLKVSKEEANTLEKIRNCSKKVPTLIDAWDDKRKRQYIIIMSLVPGISLREWMKSHKKESLETRDIFVRVKIIQQICEIMRDLTQKNPWLVHRDLKPENIYINFNKTDKKWEIYIIDFGCANLNFVRHVGTADYQAPEQIALKNAGVRINEAVDMFAIGQIFYELLIGRPPVIGEDYTYNYKGTEWTTIPELPAYLLKINGMQSVYDMIQRMTLRDPEQRADLTKVIRVLRNVRIG